MVRRLICLGAILLVALLSGVACDKTAKTKTESIQADPDKVAPPKPGGKAG
jgi:hypothetical protein